MTLQIVNVMFVVTSGYYLAKNSDCASML